MFKKILAALVVALLIAVGIGVITGQGANAARLLTGHDIKNGSISHADLNKSINRQLKAKAKPGVRGAQGLPGPAGKDGLNGTDGKNGVDGQDGTNGTNGTDGKDGVDGQDGAVGPKGDSGLEGAYYSLAKYNVGDTNAGAIATVACSNVTDVAVSGGVQMIGLGGHNSAVGSSFPGRMDWSTNTPKPGRLDGWIVQFDADAAPEKVTLWALCVPGAVIPTVETFNQAG